MSRLAIRPAHAGDLPRIAALGFAVNLQHQAHWPQLFRDESALPAQQSYWARCLRASGALCLVAERDGDFAGMLIGQVVEEPEGPLLRARRLYRVATVAVEEAFRRQGIGLALMREATHLASQAGAQELRLNVWEFNQAALALYARLGLEPRLRTLALELDRGNPQ